MTAPPCPTCPSPARRATGPSAQHAVRQAKLLADNITRRAARRAAAGRTSTRTPARSPRSGLHKGVAEIYGIKLRGFPAWFMHRTYHVSRVPTLNRKVRVVADWTLALFFKREVVPMGWLDKPFQEFEAAAGTLPTERRSRPSG